MNAPSLDCSATLLHIHVYVIAINHVWCSARIPHNFGAESRHRLISVIAPYAFGMSGKKQISHASNPSCPHVYFERLGGVGLATGYGLDDQGEREFESR
jgi:hypothetical protein